MVTGRQPVVVRLKLGGNHAQAQALATTQPVEIEIADLKWNVTTLIWWGSNFCFFSAC